MELQGRVYRCRFCSTHLAVAEDLVSRSFHGRRGKAYLLNNVTNISVGSSEERVMLTGLHVVSDIFCCLCGQNLGWKYESAQDLSQKYKEGKFILERGRIEDIPDSQFVVNAHLHASDPDDDDD